MPLDAMACSQADDVFYCLNAEMVSGGTRIPLHATSSEHSQMRQQWCALYKDILSHNSTGSPAFPACSDFGHEHHDPACPHCTQSVEPEIPDEATPQPNPDPEPEPDPDPVEPVHPCPDDPEIIQIKWVDGDGPVLVDTTTQWVNLPVEDKWVNGDEIKNKDRLGLKPKLYVKFNKPGSHAFKVKFITPTGTPSYTGTEKGRNANFNYTETEISLTTEADGTKIFDDLKVVAGGGYEFVAEAKDAKGKTVRTGKLTTKRLVYFTEAKMSGLGSVLSSTAGVTSEYDTHHIKLKKLGDLAIAHQENIGTSADTDTMEANISAAVSGSASHNTKKQHMLVVAYTDHLAVKNPNVSITSVPNVAVGPGQPTISLAVTAAGLRSPFTVKERYLWHDIVTGEGWFVEAKFHKSTGEVVDIPEINCTPNGSGDYWNQVDIDVTGLPSGQGQIRLKVNVVDRMRGGLALGGANMTCVCTKAWWRVQPDAKQACTAVHELGHKFQMVAAGTGIEPDKCANHYTAKGHVGDHCHSGCLASTPAYNNSTELAKSTCVMFGTVNQRLAFCSDCAPAVKKVDLTSGW